MRPPSLRSQLNQIRLWLRQGRTDAWIAHKLDISVAELEQFKRDHRLSGEPPPAPEIEIEPVGSEDDATLVAQEEPDEPEEGEEPVPAAPAADERAPEPEAEEDEEPQPRRRRRGRRGGRRRGSRVTSYEATFDHGEEGYGLWLDPSVADDPVYTEHWAGHRPVSVTVDVDTITIRRSGGDDS